MKTHKDLSLNTKVWIYQSNREFSSAEITEFIALATTFKENWESHGKPVKGTIELFYNRFIVVFVDEQDEQSCGRSVDASIHFIKELENELNVTLLDRLLVAYKKDGKIAVCTLAEFEKRIVLGEVNENTIVFDNTIHTKTEFENNWEVPLKKSWHSRMLAI